MRARSIVTLITPASEARQLSQEVNADSKREDRFLTIISTGSCHSEKSLKASDSMNHPFVIKLYLFRFCVPDF